MYSIIPILFYQGLDNWDPTAELEEIRKLTNPILLGNKEEYLIFDLRRIDPARDFMNLELRAGLLLLKIIRDPWVEFQEGWIKIKEILISMEDSKRIVVRQAHQPSLIVYRA